MKIEKHKVKNIIFLLILMSVMSQSCKVYNTNSKIDPASSVVHGIVFQEENQYGGWPANVGIWSWDNEILVGFTAAEYKQRERSLHSYDPNTAKTKFGRSLDGGVTWTVEDGYDSGIRGKGSDHIIADEKSAERTELKNRIPDLSNSDFALTFMRLDNNIGPSDFYYSTDRGKEWKGPFILPDLGSNGIATRTDYIVESKDEISAFVTVAKQNKKEGRVAFIKTRNGGLDWNLVSYVGDEPAGFDIMPSSVRISSDELLTIIRTRTEKRQDLLTSYYSEDNGLTWNKLNNPANDTGRGGSPPAVIKLKDGRLALTYIYRSFYGSRVNLRLSSDHGKTWSDEIILRCCDGANGDAGYPRMVQRPDGKIVVVYYWNNVNAGDQTNPYRYIAYTIVDPDKF